MPAGEAIEFAKRAKDAGVECHLRPLPEGSTIFILGAGRVPEVDKAIEEIGRWLRSKLGLLSWRRLSSRLLAVIARKRHPNSKEKCMSAYTRFKVPVLPLAVAGHVRQSTDQSDRRVMRKSC